MIGASKGGDGAAATALIKRGRMRGNDETLTSDDAQWLALLARRRGMSAARPGGGALIDLYGPLCTVPVGASFAVAHLAQSLDGRIATAGGASRWLSGDEDLLHTHRMRALADAVVVGAGTVREDDPALTVRHCAGKHPVRVVIDADRRLSTDYRVFHDTTAPTLLLAAEDCVGRGEFIGAAEIVPLPRQGDILAPTAIRSALAARGLHWLFVEGGGITISHFIAAGCLDRLQLTVTPVLLGSGRPSVILPEIADPSHGLRPRIRRAVLGDDVLFECIFDG